MKECKKTPLHLLCIFAKHHISSNSYAITINLEHWVSTNTKRGWILDEGDYNYSMYVEQCNLKGHACTHESHVFQSVRIFNSQVIRLHHSLKSRRDCRHHHHGLLTSHQLAAKYRMLREKQFHFAWGTVHCMLESLLLYTTHTLTVKTIQGWSLCIG